jgi:hypothetical protein
MIEPVIGQCLAPTSLCSQSVRRSWSSGFRRLSIGPFRVRVLRVTFTDGLVRELDFAGALVVVATTEWQGISAEVDPVTFAGSVLTVIVSDTLPAAR